MSGDGFRLSCRERAEKVFREREVLAYGIQSQERMNVENRSLAW
jgi:hypothetical protein